MDTPELVAVVMAGGSGTRFWPLSTATRPKQFVELFGGRTLLQHAVDRLAGLVPRDRTLVLTAARHAALAREQLPELPPANVVGEPVARDTAAAVALATHLARRRFPGAVLLVVTADHDIRPAARLRELLAAAAAGAAASGAVYTLGIRPDRPATEYGYLELGDPVEAPGAETHRALGRFVEKPDAETARGFLAAGTFLWNSGMFVIPPGPFWAALTEHLPAHAAALGEVPLDAAGAPEEAALAAALGPLEKVSVDHGVMEKLAGIRCLEADLAWTDVAGWRALEQRFFGGGEAPRHQGRVEALGGGGCFVFCEDPGETVALLGVEDLVVVRCGDRTLVAHKDRLGELKALVTERLTPPEPA